MFPSLSSGWVAFVLFSLGKAWAASFSNGTVLDGLALRLTIAVLDLRPVTYFL
jgi:hypothetical protein